jgi:hypothetical protein
MNGQGQEYPEIDALEPWPSELSRAEFLKRAAIALNIPVEVLEDGTDPAEELGT